MTRLEFQGTVSHGDLGAIFVGGIDIVDEIAEHNWGKNVTVTLNGEVVANGEAVAEKGWGYSEYTPMEDDSVFVGECNLIELLRNLEGKEVVLLVEDEDDPNN